MSDLLDSIMFCGLGVVSAGVWAMVKLHEDEDRDYTIPPKQQVQERLLSFTPCFRIRMVEAARLAMYTPLLPFLCRGGKEEQKR